MIRPNGQGWISHANALAARERIELAAQRMAERNLIAYQQRQQRASVIAVLALTAIVAVLVTVL